MMVACKDDKLVIGQIEKLSELKRLTNCLEVLGEYMKMPRSHAMPIAQTFTVNNVI